MTDTQLTKAQQQVLAGQLFAQIADMAMWDLEGMEPLYIRVIAEAPDTVKAEEAIWYLSNMYLQAFEPPRYHEAIELFEHSLVRYPGSTRLDDKFPLFSRPGLPLVINRLLFLYEETGAWDKAADLFQALIPEPSHPVPEQLEHLAYYGRVMEEAGRIDEAVIAFHFPAPMTQAGPDVDQGIKLDEAVKRVIWIQVDPPKIILEGSTIE